MCSIIAANRQGDLDLVFLENRDRPKELFIGNDIRRIGDVIGIYDFRAKGIASGYSLESETAGGVANILGYTGSKSRGAVLLRRFKKVDQPRMRRESSKKRLRLESTVRQLMLSAIENQSLVSRALEQRCTHLKMEGRNLS